LRALRKRKPQETQALAFLAVFVYATHATQAIALEWKPGFRLLLPRGLSRLLRRLLFSCCNTAPLDSTSPKDTQWFELRQNSANSQPAPLARRCRIIIYFYQPP